MEVKESDRLELKAEVTKTFLKTVCAYANYQDGEILFGIDDYGTVVGIEHPKEESLRIEHMINDSIQPTPRHTITVKETESKTILLVAVKKGKDTPYYYQGKAYKRSATSTVEVDRFELRRLAMEGINANFEEKKASSQDLHFSTLETHLKKEVGLERMSLDILKTLQLYHRDGYYTIAGELLADQNEFDFSGVDIVKFGKSINQILYRETIHRQSLLTQFHRAIAIFEQYYVFEEIRSYNRIQKELIPREAFREALANAMVHRVWDISSYIQIAMYEDRIEISSPGGLPAGISKEEYLHGNISVLRNPIIAGVFSRLNMIEKFGTGIARINEEYFHSTTKPGFDVTENRIRIILPITEVEKSGLSQDELLVYGLLKENPELSRKEIDAKTGFDKSKTIRILNQLIHHHMIKKEGSGAAVTYKLK